jgi:thymidylate synthase (FAD)
VNEPELVWITPNAEKTIAYCARVSSPQNQDNVQTAPGLLRYCIKNGHWSIFEQANMCVSIITTRAIAQQILRHRSFSFQEFSQRYAPAVGFQVQEARRQDLKNRQNSTNDLPAETKKWFESAQEQVGALSFGLYQAALDKGIAKECARFLLPLNTHSHLYMNGTVRSWIHYLQLRCGNGTQKEHALIARYIRDNIFEPNLPSVYYSLWGK